MLVSTLDYSTYVGRIAIGGIERGRVRVGDRVDLIPYGEPRPVEGNGDGKAPRVVQLYPDRLSLGRREQAEAALGLASEALTGASS